MPHIYIKGFKSGVDSLSVNWELQGSYWCLLQQFYFLSLHAFSWSLAG